MNQIKGKPSWQDKLWWIYIAVIIFIVFLSIFIRFIVVSRMIEYKNKIDCLEKRVKKIEVLQKDIDGVKLENDFLKKKGGV